MKRASKSYRLQLIREVVIRRELQTSNDPMANYIYQLMTDKTHSTHDVEQNHKFIGCHFDEHAGGWVNDKWGLK
ncbi:hypothetical protein ABMX80_00620 [Vibrio vulnificus]|uniref:hypothetical protein n=1 Tax=Vibrio vulnificus TaxID=672 RepID=UPI004057DB91